MRDFRRTIAMAFSLQWFIGALVFHPFTAAAQAIASPTLEVQTGNSIKRTREPDGLIVVDSQDHLLASYSRSETVLWDLAKGVQVRRFPTDRVIPRSAREIPVPAQREQLIESSTPGLTSTTAVALLWDALSGRVLKEVPMGFATGGYTVLFAPGLQYAAVIASGRLIVRSLVSGDLVLQLENLKGDAATFAFSSDGHRLAVGSGKGLVSLWDLKSRKQVWQGLRHNQRVEAIALSPDGSRIASAEDTGEVFIEDLNSSRPARRVKVDRGIDSLVFDPEGNKLAISTNAGDGRLFFVDEQSGAVVSKDSTQDWGTSAMLWLHAGLVSFVLDNDARVKIRIRDPNSRAILRDLAGIVTPSEHVATSSTADTWLTTVGNANATAFWDLAGGLARSTDLKTGSLVKPLATSGAMPDFLLVALGEIAWVNSAAGRVSPIATDPANMGGAATIDSGRTLLAHVAATGMGPVTVRNLSDGRILWRKNIAPSGMVRALAMSGNGERLAIGVQNFAFLTQHSAGGGISAGIAFSRQQQPVVRIVDAHTGELQKDLEEPPVPGLGTYGTLGLAFFPDGRHIASVMEDGTIAIWDLDTRSLEARFGSGALDISLMSGGKRIVAAMGDRSRIWDVESRRWLADLFVFAQGWLVVDPEGHFDTNDLEALRHVSWFMPDSPLSPWPIELLMRDYYEPQLLPRILAGESLKPVRPLNELNRLEARVQITRVVQDPASPDFAIVDVAVKGSPRREIIGAPPKAFEATDAYDLRVFRDGQLVGYVDGRVAESDSEVIKTFHVKLPSNANRPALVFSAYAFNKDRVKSETIRYSMSVPKPKAISRPRAYVVAMGVNEHENSAWNLRYAANDAILFSNTLVNRLRNTKNFSQVIAVNLLSDKEHADATKAAFRAAIARLAGKRDVLPVRNGAELDQLRTATPDDLVILFFAGHGGADSDGNFYLITQETGKGLGRTIDANIRRLAISSQELSEWLRDLDAGESVLVVDACHSAAGVQGPDFKPGPMGARGLGQLSFDKGMRVLAASQSDGFALEDKRLQHGLLTYSLIVDGLESFDADFSPKDGRILVQEWLQYGEKRVPTLAEELKGSHSSSDSVAGRLVTMQVNGVERPLSTLFEKQHPKLFDFSRQDVSAVIELRP